MTTHHRTNRVRRRGTIRAALNVLWLVLAFCGLGLAGYDVGTGRWHATPVLSGSMRPGLQPGDVVLTQRVPITDLQVRDVIVFRPPTASERLTVHRIVKLTVKGATTSITTWGDANMAADPTVSSMKGTTAYRVVRVVPLVGYPAIWLQNGNRGLMVIGLGVLLLLAAAFTLLRPDKPAKPAGPDDPPDDARSGSASIGGASARSNATRMDPAARKGR